METIGRSSESPMSKQQRLAETASSVTSTTQTGAQQPGTSAFAELYCQGAITAVPMATVPSLSLATAAYLLPWERTAAALATLARFTALPSTVVVMMRTNERRERDREATAAPWTWSSC
jgi:hypothetical protein